MRVINVGVYPPPYGGVSVHLKRLLEYLQAKGQDTLLIDLSPIPKKQPGIKNLSWGQALWILLLFAPKSIVHFHSFSMRETFYFFIVSFRHKTILSFHNERFITDLNSHGNFWKALALFFLNHIDLFIVDSQHSKDLVASIVRNERKIDIIPEYIPPSSIPPLDHEKITALRKAHQYVLASNAFQISFYNDQDLYGLDILIELVNRLYNIEHIDVGMIFLLPRIEKPEYFEEMKRRVADAGLVERFLFVTDPVEEAVSVWQICDIVIRATNTDGNSLTVLEALSVQVPVIASDCSERPEGAILFKTRDIEDLSEKVRTVLTHPDFYRSRLKNITLRDNAADLLCLYKKISNE